MTASTKVHHVLRKLIWYILSQAHFYRLWHLKEFAKMHLHTASYHNGPLKKNRFVNGKSFFFLLVCRREWCSYFVAEIKYHCMAALVNNL